MMNNHQLVDDIQFNSNYNSKPDLLCVAVV